MQKHTPRKRFGQNFLTDEYIINQIIKLISPVKNDHIVEIGPGLGALTSHLINSECCLDVVELDRDLVIKLHSLFGNKITIHSGDALRFDYSFGQESIRVIGNLPYNISTPLLFHLTKFNNIVDMHFMLQKEVVDRICAKPGTSDYGRLSVMLQYRYKCTSLLNVDNSSFTPAPKVDSAIVRLVPITPITNVDEKKLNLVVSTAFNQRRKMVINSLKNLVESSTFEKLGIDSNVRAQNLSITNFIDLANNLSN